MSLHDLHLSQTPCYITHCALCLFSVQPQEQQQQQPQAPPQPEAYSGPKDVILVTDADSATGELVTLQLILLRCVGLCGGLSGTAFECNSSWVAMFACSLV